MCFVATSGARKVQFYKLKNIVCAVGLIASPIGLYRKMFSLIIFLGLHKVMRIRVRGGLCLVFFSPLHRAMSHPNAWPPRPQQSWVCIKVELDPQIRPSSSPWEALPAALLRDDASTSTPLCHYFWPGKPPTLCGSPGFSGGVGDFQPSGERISL